MVVLKKRKMYIRTPATATAMKACLWISRGARPLVIAANIGTERIGSRIINNAANE